jgi:hypothetical protein
MDPGADARQGEWITGPDGRREADVRIVGASGGDPRSVLIECKDFDPKTTGRVGIGYVDGLDSKRRDLGVDVALICSNAGFTRDAKRKAKRVGIGLIGVMRKGDDRIRVFVEEPMYIRQMEVTRLDVTLRHQGATIQLPTVPFGEILHEGRLLAAWIARRVTLLLASSPIVQGTFRWDHALTEPVTFDTPMGAVTVDEINFEISLTGRWTVQPVILDASNGFYDWLRKRMRPASGQFEVKNLDFFGGKPIKQPPDYVLNQEELKDGEIVLQFMKVRGLWEPAPAPDLDRFVRPEDLEDEVGDLPEEVFRSDPDYTPDTAPATALA